MNRPFWLIPPAKLSAKLDSTKCQEYLRLIERLFRVDPWWGSHFLAYSHVLDDEHTQEQEPELSEVIEHLRHAYRALSPRQRAAVDEYAGFRRANFEIAKKIRHKWDEGRLAHAIRDVEAERTFIEIMRLRYPYPDYSELVGEPSDSDFEDVTLRDGSTERGLTIERKADLLLVGVFEWKGTYITNYHDHRTGEKGWFVFISRRYKPKNWLGCHFLNYDGLSRVPDRRFKEVRFWPFLNEEMNWLHNVLIDAALELSGRSKRNKFQRVRFKDGNPYNCLPDNMDLFETRGRRMRCGLCGRRTTANDSIVFSGKGRKIRTCLDCSRDLHSVDV